MGILGYLNTIRSTKSSYLCALSPILLQKGGWAYYTRSIVFVYLVMLMLNILDSLHRSQARLEQI